MAKKRYGHPGFYELLERMAQVHSDKNHDYAGFGGDPLANFRVCENMGVEAWRGALVRICDKISRVWSFAKQDELTVKDESVEDTLLDMSNYCLLCLLLYRERDKGKDE